MVCRSPACHQQTQSMSMSLLYFQTYISTPHKIHPPETPSSIWRLLFVRQTFTTSPRQILIPFRRLSRNETLNTQKDDLYLISALLTDSTIDDQAQIRTITKENHFFIRHTNEKLTNSLMTDTELSASAACSK